MKVYCDMDGVLANFITPAREVTGIPFQPGVYVKVDKNDWRKLQKEWPTFWLDLDMLPYAKELWRSLAPWSPSILTAIPDIWPSAATGKLVWIKNNLPKFGYHPNQTFHAVKREDKQRFAMSNGQPNVLIDDMETNIREWNQAGGIGIRYLPSRSAIQTVVATIQSIV